MTLTASNLVPAPATDDDLGIVYLIETAQQFWSELEDILKLPSNEYQTLTLLDSALRRFLALCVTYHEQYLQSPLQLEHAFEMLLDSELFEFHSERMCEIIVDDIQSNTNPHSQFISYNILFWYGKRKPDFLRSQKRWQPLLPLLMDHIMVDIDPDIEDTYIGTAGTSNGIPSVPVPIEAKLRTLGVKFLYEICKMQKFSLQDLRIYDDSFIDYLFDLVEQTRYMPDDTFNYSVIKLIVSLNEQFMVASLPSDSHHVDAQSAETKNRVLLVLMRRLGFSKTFGENMIFMLNRAKRTSEDLCMQLLILKILYLIFTTKGTSEYFYTNDLCVLVDVFLRELADLDEESESLRHNYLRVLHPLLTKTQLRDYPYKRPQILYALESLTNNSTIRDINPTTKRLAERCLSGDWRVQLQGQKEGEGINQNSDNNSETSAHAFISPPLVETAARLERSSSRGKTLKMSKSVENLKVRHHEPRPPLPSLDRIRRTSNSSATSLPAVAGSGPTPIAPKRRGTAGSTIVGGAYADKHDRAGSHDPEHDFHKHHHQLLAPGNPLKLQQQARTRNRPPPPPPVQTRIASSLVSTPSPTSTTSPVSDQPQSRPHRRPPPAPPKRRKPPAIPAGRTDSGATITVIRSSSEVAGTPLIKAAAPRPKQSSGLQRSTVL